MPLIPPTAPDMIHTAAFFSAMSPNDKFPLRTLTISNIKKAAMPHISPCKSPLERLSWVEKYAEKYTDSAIIAIERNCAVLSEISAPRLPKDPILSL